MLRKSAVTKTIALLYLPFFTSSAHLYVHQGTAVQGDGLGSPPKNLAVGQGAGTTLHLPSTFLLLWISLLPSIPTTIPSQGASSPSPPVLPSQPLLSLFALRASLGGTTFPCFQLSMIKCNSRQLQPCWMTQFSIFLRGVVGLWPPALQGPEERTGFALAAVQ